MTGPTQIISQAVLQRRCSTKGSPEANHIETHCRRSLTIVGFLYSGYWIDDIQFYPKQADTAQFIFTFDDNTRDIYDIAYPILDEYGFSGSADIITELINNPDRLTSDEIRELHDNGWSINSHTHTHSTLHGLSKAEQRREIKTAAETLKAHGFDEPTAIMYPGGQCDQTTLELAAEYHQCGFTAHTSIRKGLTQTVTASSHFINRSRSSTFEEAKTAIDTAIEYTATYPAYWHTIGPDGEISEADFQAVCEYLSKRSEAIDVVRPEAITLSV